MALSINENEPLLKGSIQKEDHNNKSYDGVLVKNIDEEHLVTDSSSQTTIDEHDPEYIVKNRLGDTSLAMITIW
jgi:hypothetical protein